VPSVLTCVDGEMASSAWLAASWGVSGEAEARLRGESGLASGTVRWLALLSLLAQVHRSVPSRTRSDPRQARQAEVGVLHDGAREAGHLGLLDVDEQLGGRARGELAVGGGAEDTDDGATGGEDDGEHCGHEPAQHRTTVEDAHGSMVPRRRCEIAETLCVPQAGVPP